MPITKYDDLKFNIVVEGFKQRRRRIRDRQLMVRMNKLVGKQSFRHQKNQPKPEPKVFNFPEKAQELYDAAFRKYWNMPEGVTAEEYALYWGLKDSLRYEKKLALRIMHLAYGFLNGKKYSEIESSTHSHINLFEKKNKDVEESITGILKNIWYTARKHYEGDSRELAQRWAEWVDDLREHIKSQSLQLGKTGKQIQETISEVSEGKETPHAEATEEQTMQTDSLG